MLGEMFGLSLGHGTCLHGYLCSICVFSYLAAWVAGYLIATWLLATCYLATGYLVTWLLPTWLCGYMAMWP